MSKRNLVLLLILVLAAGSAVYVYRDWFKPESIQIAVTVRPAPAPRRPSAPRQEPFSGKPGYNVTFVFNQKLNLTAVKVFSLQDALTNKYPYPLWNLVSESNSPPIKSLVYGGRVRGLHPTVKGGTAVPLEAGSAYRLLVKAGDRTAEKDFEIPR